MVGGIGIRGGEHFVLDACLWEICDTEESAKVLVLNPTLYARRSLGVQSLPDLEVRIRLTIFNRAVMSRARLQDICAHDYNSLSRTV